MSRAPTRTEERALQLLGSGVGPEQVAAALGVTTSAISQLLSDPEFTAQVATLRFQSLSRHNDRDNKYDALEDKLVEKLEDLLPLMMRPMEVLKSIQVINAAKRRGQSAPEQITNQQNIVNITMPSIVVNRFVTNIQNQVIQAGNQELLTIQSGSLLKEANAAKEIAATAAKGAQNDNLSQRVTQHRIGSPKEDSPRSQQEEGRFLTAGSFVPVGG